MPRTFIVNTRDDFHLDEWGRAPTTAQQWRAREPAYKAAERAQGRARIQALTAEPPPKKPRKPRKRVPKILHTHLTPIERMARALGDESPLPLGSRVKTQQAQVRRCLHEAMEVSPKSYAEGFAGGVIEMVVAVYCPDCGALWERPLCGFLGL